MNEPPPENRKGSKEKRRVMMDNNEIVLFESEDGSMVLDVNIDLGHGDVWLTKEQIAALFERDRTVIGRHIANIYREGELEREGTCANNAQVRTEGTRKVTRQEELYNLDVIISVGYRVKSQRGVEFRRWATEVLRSYVIEGHAKNEHRLKQLGQIAEIIDRLPEEPEGRQILDIVKSYTKALDLLDDYDHQTIRRPKGSKAEHVLSYEECRKVIDSMRFGAESDLFGVEKDDSFRGCIGNIHQTFGAKISILRWRKKLQICCIS